MVLFGKNKIDVSIERLIKNEEFGILCSSGRGKMETQPRRTLERVSTMYRARLVGRTGHRERNAVG